MSFNSLTTRINNLKFKHRRLKHISYDDIDIFNRTIRNIILSRDYDLKSVNYMEDQFFTDMYKYFNSIKHKFHKEGRVEILISYLDSCKSHTHKMFRHISYKSYLRSNRWKRTRLEALKYYNHTCQLCGATKSLQVYHRSRVNIGNEDIVKELIVVCSKCYIKIDTDINLKEYRYVDDSKVDRSKIIIRKKVDCSDIILKKKKRIDSKDVYNGIKLKKKVIKK